MDSKSRKSRTWSLSRKSKDHEPIKLTPEQKRRSKMTSMVDPTRALNEEEPFAVSQSKVGESIRTLQHRDIYGNLIAEPDRSNPTRSRWERPLETIRSFEAAINNDAKRQSAFYVVDTVDNMDHSQRQIQHNPGPFDSSLYHRNNGAQRYAPIDAYSSQRNSYYRHNSQDREQDYRPLPPSSHRYDRRSPSRTPPLAVPNGHRPGEQPPIPISQDNNNRKQPAGIRQYPDSGYHYSSSNGSAGPESFQYNSDPPSESSSLGPHTPVNPGMTKEQENMFSFNSTTAPIQLQYPASSPSGLDGPGYGYAGGVADGQMNGNGYTNGNVYNGNHGAMNGTGVMNGNSKPNVGPTSPGSIPSEPQRKSTILRKPIPLGGSGDSTAPAAVAPEKKKGGFFKRLSKA